MPRLYHVDLVQHVVSADARWVDNLISRFSIQGANGSGRGSSRRLTTGAVQQIALTRSLATDLGLPLNVAVSLAEALLADPGQTELPVGDWFRISFRRTEFLEHVDGLIAEGVEALTPTRRGRPPRATE